MNSQNITNETQLLNHQFISLVRNTLNSNPDMLEKVLGINIETAQALADLSPSMLDTITKTSIVYFRPRVSAEVLQSLAQAAQTKDPVEIDCNVQHAVALAS